MTRGSQRTKVAMQALAVSYKGRLGDLDGGDVAAMIILAQEFLDADDPLFLACTGFATQHEIHWRDAGVVADLAETLRHDVELAMMPAPIDAERVDIYG